MANAFLETAAIAALTTAGANKTSDPFGHERFTKASVVFTATDLNAADAVVTIQARHRANTDWVVLTMSQILAAGTHSYSLDIPNAFYYQYRVIYTKNSVTVGTIKASILFKE